MRPTFSNQEVWLAKLEKLGDPLPRLDSIVDCQAFRPLPKAIHQKQRKINAVALRVLRLRYAATVRKAIHPLPQLRAHASTPCHAAASACLKHGSSLQGQRPVR